MKKILIIIASVMLIAGSTALYADKKHEHGNQKLCPVMNGKINKSIYSDYKDNRVFFCCPGCVQKFNAKPVFYLKKMKAKGIQPMKLAKQKLCPVMGGKINKKHFVDVKGKRLYVCCPGCIAKIKADPDKYLNKAKEKGIYFEDAE